MMEVPAPSVSGELDLRQEAKSLLRFCMEYSGPLQWFGSIALPLVAAHGATRKAFSNLAKADKEKLRELSAEIEKYSDQFAPMLVRWGVSCSNCIEMKYAAQTRTYHLMAELYPLIMADIEKVLYEGDARLLSARDRDADAEAGVLVGPDQWRHEELRKAVEFGRELDRLAGDEVRIAAERLATELRIIPPGPIIDRVSAMEMTLEQNRELLTAVAHEFSESVGGDVAQALKSEMGPLLSFLMLAVQADVERMSTDLVSKGFPDPREDEQNWRVIALMVGASTDGMHEDIYEAALAYHATEERQKKLAPGGFPDDGLCEMSRTIVWGGRTFDGLTPKIVRVFKLLIDAREKGFPDVAKSQIEKFSATEGGTKGQVFKLNRKGWPPLHPAHVLMIDNGNGTYRIIEPSKVPAESS
jgi:hypothetical protein